MEKCETGMKLIKNKDEKKRELKIKTMKQVRTWIYTLFWGLVYNDNMKHGNSCRMLAKDWLLVSIESSWDD